MLYLISDIHGDVMSFRKMLKKISFDPAVDNMIVMGDIFDWNDEGIPLLEFMSDYLVDDQMKLHGYLAHLPHCIEIESPKYGNCVVTHSGIHCGSYIRNVDRSINITESIKNAVKRDEYRFLISPDIHNVPFADKKAFDRYVFCGHVTTSRLNEDHSYNVYKTPYYMDLDCGNGERNRGGKLACYCVEEDRVVYI